MPIREDHIEEDILMLDPTELDAFKTTSNYTPEGLRDILAGSNASGFEMLQEQLRLLHSRHKEDCMHLAVYRIHLSWFADTSSLSLIDLTRNIVSLAKSWLSQLDSSFYKARQLLESNGIPDSDRALSDLEQERLLLVRKLLAEAWHSLGIFLSSDNPPFRRFPQLPV